jgi:hypothetical protein
VTAAPNAALSGRPMSCLVVAGPAGEAFEPHGVDGVGCHRQPVAVVLPLDRTLRQRLTQPGSQALQGVRRFGGRVITPDPVDQRRLRDHPAGFEREGHQQPAQPRARHLDEDAVVRANLERSQHPDLHPADSATGVEQASNCRRRLPSRDQPAWTWGRRVAAEHQDDHVGLLALGGAHGARGQAHRRGAPGLPPCANIDGTPPRDGRPAGAHRANQAQLAVYAARL